MSKKKPVEHEHRAINEDGWSTCECGEKFETDSAWRAHNQANQPKGERKRG